MSALLNGRHRGLMLQQQQSSPSDEIPRNIMRLLRLLKIRISLVAYAAVRGRFATVANTVGIAASESKAEPMKTACGEPMSIM